MISVRFANEVITIKENSTLGALLIHKGLENKTYAIALNNQFIAKSLYGTTVLKEDDCIEIIIPMQGG